MSLSTQLLAIFAVMVVAMLLGWDWQRRHRNAGIVDVIWSYGLGFAALAMAATGSGAPLARTALAVLGTAWAVRLGTHLLRRVSGEPEDGRYRNLRQHWQVGTQWKFLLLFQFQAALVVLFSLPFAAAARSPLSSAGSSWAVVGAIAVWSVSVAGEAIADAQLQAFRSDPANRGGVCRAGLWRYSRHPNYFFEWLHWFAYVLLSWDSPWWWLSWLGPVLMYAFLRWISGVPYTEAQALRSKGDAYRQYQRSTSVLIPWFPGKITR